MAKKNLDVPSAVEALCLAFPETENHLSRGSMDYRIVGGKVFATFMVNHHGDGRVALWLRSPPGAQERFVDEDPGSYFVPPYVGVKGWLGVELDKQASWASITQRVWEAYEEVAPRRLQGVLASAPKIAAPTVPMDPELVDPYGVPEVVAVLDKLRALCGQWPEVVEGSQFGDPVFKAGKKTFLGVHRNDGRTSLTFWVGSDAQLGLTEDPRFHIPRYIGHNGWIALVLAGGKRTRINWSEIEALALGSYRHFALKRMLSALDSADA